MFTSVPSLESILQCLQPAFTQPSFATQVAVFVGWVMCLGKRTEYGVFETIEAARPVSHKERHPFDRFYNFFSRSCWTVHELAHEVAVAVVLGLNARGMLYLVVDDTLLHKRGQRVYGLGWFRDAVASTAKRVATASGNHWVVMGLAIPIPRTRKIYCLPINARLHLAGVEDHSETALAREMLEEIRTWLPARQLGLVGDGGYSGHPLLGEFPAEVKYVGLMRSDAALFDPTPPPQPKSKRGPKPKKGRRLPNPKQAAQLADRVKDKDAPGAWQDIKVTAYGVRRTLQVVSFPAVWPAVLGLLPILVVLVRDPAGKLRDTYLFTTDIHAEPSWVISTYARRWSIEVAFKASKQVLTIESPQHWCQQSIEKLAPWVWLMQSVVGLWYFTVGKDLPEAQHAREQPAHGAVRNWALVGFFDAFSRIVHQMHVVHAGRTGGHASEARQATIDMLDHLACRRLVLLEHLLDQVDASAR